MHIYVYFMMLAHVKATDDRCSGQSIQCLPHWATLYYTRQRLGTWRMCLPSELDKVTLEKNANGKISPTHGQEEADIQMGIKGIRKGFKDKACQDGSI